MVDRTETGADGVGAEQMLAQAEPSASGPSSPTATADCALTAAGTPIGLPLVANDSGGEGALRVSTVGGAAHGTTVIQPDGNVLYNPDEGFVGLDQFSYGVSDGRGGAAAGNAFVLVNPAGDGAQATIDPSSLPTLAQACATATALDTVSLTGQQVAVPLPDAGERLVVDVEPGQRIELQDAAYADARYVATDDGLLIVLPDGRTTFLAGFAEAANSGNAPTLQVADGAMVAADQLYAGLDPDGVVPAFGPAGATEPSGDQADGSGANFRPYAADDLGGPLDPLGPLGPLALGYSAPDPKNPLATSNDDDSTGASGPAENQPPAITADASETLQVVTENDEYDFTTSNAFPALVEKQGITDPSLINGINSADLILDVSRDLNVSFVSDAALFQSTLGVFQVDGQGNFVNPEVVVPNTRTGITDTFTLEDVQPGSQLGFFFIQNGAALNSGIDFDQGSLSFAPDGRSLVFTPDNGGPAVPLQGVTFQSVDPSLNPDGAQHFLSGVDGNGGLLVGIEDFERTSPFHDSDYNDVVFRLDYSPLQSSVLVNLTGDLGVEITDSDSANMSFARVQLTNGAQEGDALVFDGYTVGQDGQVLDGSGNATGLSVSQNSGGTLDLTGSAPIDTYEQVLSAVRLSADVDAPGAREVSLTVLDDQGAQSQPAGVTFNVTVPDLTASSTTSTGALAMADVLDQDAGIGLDDAPDASGGGQEAAAAGADQAAPAFEAGPAMAEVMPAMPEPEQAAA
ncbi:Ig-like domain-containing protein [Marinivivus vitaminiproducens]|uniref:Ig-like domain-containing protein n=1 Tax=Marinivivus vitaminiproducens TaxID=3035935 RepID=UPI0027A9F153|nr:Ig-like domain-containing protein [Geminicoccaceae bacterium SCSIO 64248]